MRNWKLRNKKKQRRRKPYKKNLISSDSFEYERFRIPIWCTNQWNTSNWMMGSDIHCSLSMYIFWNALIVRWKWFELIEIFSFRTRFYERNMVTVDFLANSSVEMGETLKQPARLSDLDCRCMEASHRKLSEIVTNCTWF